MLIVVVDVIVELVELVELVEVVSVMEKAVLVVVVPGSVVVMEVVVAVLVVLIVLIVLVVVVAVIVRHVPSIWRLVPAEQVSHSSGPYAQELQWKLHAISQFSNGNIRIGDRFYPDNRSLKRRDMYRLDMYLRMNLGTDA